MVSLSTVLIVLVTVETGAIAVFAWRLRPKPGAKTLSALLCSVALWTGSLAGAMLAEGYTLSRVFMNLTFIGTGLTVVALAAFALEFTGRERYLQWPYPLVLGVEPLLVTVLTFTNDTTHLFWESVFRDPTHYAGFEHVGGVGATTHLAFTYLVATAAILLIAQKLFRARSVYRTQTAAVFLGAAAPLVGNVLSVYDILEIGQTLGFAITGVALYWAVSRGNLVDLSPVARATVLDNLDVGILVVDREDRIIDLNPRLRRLLSIADSGSYIGKRVGSAVSEETLPALGPAASQTFETDVDGETRIVSVQGSALRDALDREIGRLYLFDDVTDDRKRKHELELQNERLEEFAGLVSHDLRNPLDVASGYVELMRQDAGDDDTVEVETARLDATADALERMEAIVDDVLTLAREGESVTDPEVVSLRSAARTAWEHVSTAEAKLVVGTDAMVVADRGQLQRLFENLFRNAVEHGGQDVTVSVSTIAGDDGPVGFYVEDDGSGIAPEHREQVLESGVTTESEGTGFGLAIVDKLAEAHGWDIVVTESEDGGARFEITGVTLAGDPLLASERS